ncbi:hypothetical protein JCM3765_005456 [Sporobolomyces pararoseus]
MLSSLPPELLLQIIESTVPHNFHTRTYYDRQQTLCSLSLVSKQLYAIAQPLLYEVVWIKSPETFESYKTTMGTAGEAARGVGKIRRLKTVVIGSGSWNGSVTMAEEAMSKEIPEWLSSVRSLTWDLNSAAVEGLPSLTSFSGEFSNHSLCATTSAHSLIGFRRSLEPPPLKDLLPTWQPPKTIKASMSYYVRCRRIRHGFASRPGRRPDSETPVPRRYHSQICSPSQKIAPRRPLTSVGNLKRGTPDSVMP